jgi:hypothetical protein
MDTRVRAALFVLAATLTLGSRLRASCGSATCPIDSNAFNQPAPRGWALDLAFQYIDQDQPRIGTRTAAVGELPSEHDEVRTINRAATVTGRYAWSPSLHLAVSVPYVDRFHEHIAGDGDEGGSAKHAGHEHGVQEEWQLDGPGDVALQAEKRVWSGGRTSLWASATVELPTGADDLRNDDGEVAELPIQPGSGSVDAVLGFALRGSMVRQTARAGVLGNTVAVPWFATLSYRRNGKGRQSYRIGEEWQASLGAAYPLSQRLDALLQLNARRRGEDSPGTSGEDPHLTGGTYLFVSPGARLSLSGRWAVYGYLQVPLRQDVHGEQLTAKRNWLFGVQTAF